MTFLKDSWLPSWLPLTLEQVEGEQPLLEEAELEEAQLEQLGELEEEEGGEEEQQQEERTEQG